MRNEFDAVVVGAGPAGSSAGILLSRAGWSVALVEKERFPRRKVCGECIAASNLPLLEALGIGPAFDAVAGPELRRVALLCGNRSIEADLPAASHGRYPWGRALGRETLDTLLLEQARSTGAAVLQPWSVPTLEGAPGDWRCGIRSMESGGTSILRSRVAIDAPGSWEALPSARRNRHGTDGARDLLAFKANFRGASLDAGLLPVLSLDGGYGGMVVADGAVTTVACCIRRDRLGACRLASPGNWDLYTSGTGWKAHDLVGNISEGLSPYRGQYGARLGGYEGVFDTIEQSIHIPAQGTWTYWWRLGT